MKAMIYTIGATDIMAEESYECAITWAEYGDIDVAISKAIDLARELSTDNEIYNVSVYGGEYKDDNGNVFGEPYDMFTISSKDKDTTIKARTEMNYCKGEVDAYVENGQVTYENEFFQL